MSVKKASKKVRKNSVRKYRSMPNGSTFHFTNDTRTYVKICNAFSLDTATGKDIIPHLFQKVVFTGFKEGYYPLWHTGA